MNDKLFLRNPEETELGRRIIQHGIELIHQLGFEAFTFKKLAIEINTTEAGIYRYFENKHLLLVYLVDWYWSWQEYRLHFQTNNIISAEQKLKMAIALLCESTVDDVSTTHINEALLFDIVMSEGSKSYHTSHVVEYNELKLYKPYKDFCSRIAELIAELNPAYDYPHSLASTVIEMAHSLIYFMKNLPSMTDFGSSDDKSKVIIFLEDMLFATIKNAK